jgi:hypothetical protein
MEGDKKREYGERIREVEHGSFTPLDRWRHGPGGYGGGKEVGQ